jgi:tetratricopeptide (TPR) repeat protein
VFPVPEIVQSWFGSATAATVLFYGGGGVLLLALLVAGWLIFGPGPRIRRAVRRAQNDLQQGDWRQALESIQRWGRPSWRSPRQLAQLERLEGKCYRAAGVAALLDKRFEEGLENFRRAARLFHADEQEAFHEVVEAMLAEVRRLFSAPPTDDSGTVPKLIGRVLDVESGCAEAYFWQGMCHLREGSREKALASLNQSRANDAGPRGLAAHIDPPLYLGALLLRDGKTDEALRYLAEANRLDPNCPFVTWQLGMAMLAAGGDALIAVRALQRALGLRGLQLWVHTPERAWVEGFPEKRSFVRTLASAHAFHCPLFGDSIALMLRQGQIALGHGQYRLGNFEDAAKTFHLVFQEGVPSLPVLRGLGLSLARLERYDEAFKHLRAAHELEEPKNILTAGYLALCGAKGKPTRPEDKTRNVGWAIRLVAKFTVLGNTEWADLLNQIFAEARAIDLPVELADQNQLCDTLVSVDAADPASAAAYSQFERDRGKQQEAGQIPAEPSRPEYAWLFCRAAQKHGCTAENELAFFARALETEAAARPFFAQRQWDFDEVEYTFLERWADRHSGQYPPSVGSEFAARGERLLLGRSQGLEQMGDARGARACAEVLLKLDPANARAHDRLAYLCYQSGDLDRAADLVADWHRLDPEEPLPLLRRAVLEYQRGNYAQGAESIRGALDRSHGRQRADIALVGARLQIRQWLGPPRTDCQPESRNGEARGPGWSPAASAAGAALAFLDECLAEDPSHETALWCKAAVCCALGQVDSLRNLARPIGRLEREALPRDARFHFLAAVCHLAAEDGALAGEAAARAEEQDSALTVECAYLKGWAAYLQGDAVSAREWLRLPAQTGTAASQAHAQALLGHIAFARGDFDEAASWWKNLDSPRRKDWALDGALRDTVFIEAVAEYHQGHFEQAAETLRQAGRLGLRDRRLGPLLKLALLKAGQRLLYGSADIAIETDVADHRLRFSAKPQAAPLDQAKDATTAP